MLRRQDFDGWGRPERSERAGISILEAPNLSVRGCLAKHYAIFAKQFLALAILATHCMADK